VIVFSVICKVLNVFPSNVEDGARAVYKAVSGYFIYPLMIGLGMLYIPLASVMSVLSVGYVATVILVVCTMAASGFFVGRWVGMYPVDAFAGDLVPQRAGWDRGCCHPLGVRPDVAHAVRSDLHPDRWRDHRDHGGLTDPSVRLALPSACPGRRSESLRTAPRRRSAYERTMTDREKLRRIFIVPRGDPRGGAASVRAYRKNARGEGIDVMVGMGTEWVAARGSSWACSGSR